MVKKGKLILICQSGGSFVTTGDGSLIYTGGEANAMNITPETAFDDLKLKLAEVYDLDLSSVSAKYFLPGNNRALFNLNSDRDLKRMLDIHATYITAKVFVSGNPKATGVELAETVNHNHRKSYNRLPWFCEKVQETNPGSVTRLMVNAEKRFERLFVSFIAAIHGFQNGCRPLIFLEASNLRSKYKETLLTATAVDADDRFFPVSFAIVDIENGDSWRWFLEQLKTAISALRPVTFISDREKNLKSHVLEVFENGYHGYSIFHLMESLKKNIFQGDGQGDIPGVFLAAAHAVRLDVFRIFMEQIKQISPSTYYWVNQIEPEQWTTLLFKGVPYNYITHNVAEAYSKLIEDMRGSTIMQKIDALICMLSEQMNHGREESSNCFTKLAPSKEQQLLEKAIKAQSMKVFFSSEAVYVVHDDLTHVVNIENKDCTCLEWKFSGLPCCHAVAVFLSSSKNVYDYCPQWFTVESFRFAYSEPINPIPGIGKLVEDEVDSESADVLPPLSPFDKTECSSFSSASLNEAIGNETLMNMCFAPFWDFEYDLAELNGTIGW
nr:uncharacterized protein LOC109167005 [Ipomoea trifida]